MTCEIQISLPLRNAAIQAQRALLKNAHATIFTAEKQVLAIDESDTRYFTKAQRVQSRLEVLRELVAVRPEQSQNIRSAMEEVRMVSKPKQASGGSWRRMILFLVNLCVLTMVV